MKNGAQQEPLVIGYGGRTLTCYDCPLPHQVRLRCRSRYAVLQFGLEAGLRVDIALRLLTFVGQRPLDNRPFHQNRDRFGFPDRITVHSEKVFVEHDQVGKLPHFD